MRVIVLREKVGLLALDEKEDEGESEDESGYKGASIGDEGCGWGDGTRLCKAASLPDICADMSDTSLRIWDCTSSTAC